MAALRYSVAEPTTQSPVLEPGKVLIVRGRTATGVYHLTRTCFRLLAWKTNPRPVKKTYADAAGLRPCTTCGHTTTVQQPLAVTT